MVYLGQAQGKAGQTSLFQRSKQSHVRKLHGDGSLTLTGFTWAVYCETMHVVGMKRGSELCRHKSSQKKDGELIPGLRAALAAA